MVERRVMNLSVISGKPVRRLDDCWCDTSWHHVRGITDVSL